MACFGAGKIFRRYEAGSDNYSVKEINENCKECNGYGYILEIHEFPDDIVVNRVSHIESEE